jgi:hypothetical protein
VKSGEMYGLLDKNSCEMKRETEKVKENSVTRKKIKSRSI